MNKFPLPPISLEELPMCVPEKIHFHGQNTFIEWLSMLVKDEVQMPFPDLPKNLHRPVKPLLEVPVMGREDQ